MAERGKRGGGERDDARVFPALMSKGKKIATRRFSTKLKLTSYLIFHDDDM